MISKSIHSLNQITSNLTPPSKNSILPVTSISASITQFPSSTEKNKISQSSNTSNKIIRIIDNIPKALQTNNLNLIKKRIKETTTVKIPIDFTYTLPKGGIAIPLPCEEDAKKLENNLDQIYPGSHCQQPQSNSGYNKVIVKNLDPSIPTQEIKQNIEEAYQTTIQINRYHSSLTKRPLPIICITFKGDTYPNFLSKDIRIFNKSYKCQPYNKPAICCFNCQKIGHIARNCRNRNCCHNCGETHLENSYCSKNPACANCNIKGHSSTSRDCPIYIKLKAQLQHEVPSTKYYLF